MVRDAGRYVMVGQYTDAGDVDAQSAPPPQSAPRDRARLLGLRVHHLYRSVEMMARHQDRFAWARLVTREYALAEAERALADMEALAVVKALIRPGRRHETRRGPAARVGARGGAPRPLAWPLRFLREQWPASWIAAREGPDKDAGVFHFRRTIRLAAAPERLVVHVSADNRYLLHVNGRRVGSGPARSDVLHWAFEILRPRAVSPRRATTGSRRTVWNFGTLSPMAQMSRPPGFLLQGDDEAASSLNTGEAWEATHDPGHAPNPRCGRALRARRFYYAAGPGERRDGSLWDWQWDGEGSPAARWKPARTLSRGHPNTIRKGPGWLQTPEGWLLEPSPLPAMEHREIPGGRLARASGIEAGAFPGGGVARARGERGAAAPRPGRDRERLSRAARERGQGARCAPHLCRGALRRKRAEGRPQRHRG